MPFVKLCAVLGALLLGAQASAAALAHITILEGDAKVIRGTRIANAALGLALDASDIVQTANSSSLLRVEFADQTMLDLGPGTRVLLRPALPPQAGGTRAHAYVLVGWGKVSVAAKEPATEALLLLPRLALSAHKTCVIEVQTPAQSTQVLVFSEGGEVRAVPINTPSNGPPVALKPGQFLSALDEAAPRVDPRPPPTWLQSVPLTLRDNLPARAARFAQAPIELGTGKEVSYADVAPWLNAEPALRQALLPRWKPRALDAVFKTAVLRDMALHPEWAGVFAVKKPGPRFEPIMNP